MKTVQLQEFKEISAKDVLKRVLNQAPRGMDIEEMGRRWEILKKIEKSDGAVELENAEWERLRQVYRQFPFQFMDEALLEIGKDIESAKE